MTQSESNALVPKRRFPEFRNDHHWIEAPMGEIYTFKSNNSLSRDKLNYDTGTIKNIHYGDIHTKFPARFDIRNEIVPFINPSEQLNAFHSEDCVEGDMIFADASEDLKDIGKSIELVHLNGERVVAGLHTILARPDLDRLAIGFGAYLFQSRRVRAQIQKEAQGAKVLGISATRLSRIQLPLPPTKAEQQKIAACLSSLDDLIEAESRKLDALKAHKRGLMQRLFPREGETVPQLRFPEFRKAPGWNVCALSTLISSLDAGVSVNGGDRPASKSELGVLKTSAVTNGFFEPNENKVVLEATEQARLAEPVQADTIIISRMNTPALVGASAYVHKSIPNLFLPDRLWAAKPRENVSMRFLSFVLGSDWGRTALAALATGTSGSMKNISKQDVLNLPVKVPTFHEQVRIAACLSSLDDLITEQIDKLAALRAHKRGLLQQLFPSRSEIEP